MQNSTIRNARKCDNVAYPRLIIHITKYNNVFLKNVEHIEFDPLANIYSDVVHHAIKTLFTQ